MAVSGAQKLENTLVTREMYVACLLVTCLAMKCSDERNSKSNGKSKGNSDSNSKDNNKGNNSINGKGRANSSSSRRSMKREQNLVETVIGSTAERRASVGEAVLISIPVAIITFSP